MNRRELTAAIRYQLERLRARNGQHEFEHLCRQLARCTISPRVVPATGPVGAGGDQGRDFETYRSYSGVDSGPADSFFGARAGSQRLVFSCTLQSSDVPSKIRKDVESILAAGSKPDTIYAFCEANIAVAQRHKLQRWALEDHSVELEILDGEAIAEQLTDPRTFWIAVEYLEISIGSFPTSSAGHPAYSQQLADWRENDRKIASYNSLLEAREALHTCVETDELRADYPFWESVFRTFVSTRGLPAMLRRKAVYELCWSAVQVKGHMLSHESILRWYFLALRGNVDAKDLKAACTLLTYSYAMSMLGGLGIPRSRLDDWYTWLEQEVDARIDEELRPSERCMLIAQRGHLQSMPRPGVDFDEAAALAVATWQGMLDGMESARQFSVQDFATTLAKLTGAFGAVEGFGPLTARLDEIVASRAGDAAVAGTRMERAKVQRRAGNKLAALRELHGAKLSYHAGESADHLVDALVQISHLYEDLGMHLAAKHYALAAVAVGRLSDGGWAANLLVHAIRCIGDADYQMGMWTEAIEAFELALRTSAVVQGSFDAQGDDQIERMIIGVCFPLCLAEDLSLALVDAVHRKLDDNPYGPSVQHNMPDAHRFLVRIRTGLEDDALASPPFSDTGVERTYRWCALGVRWRVTCSNDRLSASAAEALGAAIQVLLVELAEHDPCFLPGTVLIRLSEDGSKGIQSMQAHGGTCEVVVRLASEDLEKMESTALVSLALQICLLGCTHPDPSQWVASLDVPQCFSKVAVGGPYVRLLDDLFEHGERVPIETTETDSKCRFEEPPEVSELAASTGLAPWLDDSSIEAEIAHRYRSCTASLPRTLDVIRSTASAVKAVETLRNDGMKDWHILAAIVNLVANVRFAEEAGRPPSGEDLQRMRELVESGDAASDYDVVGDMFDEAALREAENAFVGAFVAGSGASVPHGYGDIDSFRRFALARLGYDRDIDDAPDFLAPAAQTALVHRSPPQE